MWRCWGIKIQCNPIFYRKFINFGRMYVEFTDGSFKVGSLSCLPLPHRLIFALLCITSVGANRSTPLFVNAGLMDYVRTDGRSVIKASKFFAFQRLQNEHLLAILFMVDLTLTIQYFCLSVERTYFVTICPRLCMFLTMSLLIRCFLGKIIWCLGWVNLLSVIGFFCFRELNSA